MVQIGLNGIKNNAYFYVKARALYSFVSHCLEFNNDIKMEKRAPHKFQ